MRQKLSLGAAMALVVALAVLTFGPSLAAGTGEDHSLVLRAHEDQSAEIDLGDKGLSLGDQLVFSDTLYRDDEKVGHDGATCTIVRLSDDKTTPTANCVGTLSLNRGQITVEGLVTFSENDTSPFTIAVTGGTGTYRSVGGEMEIQPAEDDGGDQTLTLSLDDP